MKSLKRKMLFGIGAAVFFSTCSYAAAPLYKASPKNAISNQYIVVYSDAQVSTAETTSDYLANKFNVVVIKTFSSALKGSLISASEAQVSAMQNDPSVKYIEQNQIISVSPIYSGDFTAQADQAKPTWGLDRIDQRELPLNESYKTAQDGTGVTAYVIDTGVRMTHQEFAGGPPEGSRARSGWDFINDDNNADDCNGHGTHVAGTIAGATYGVAKNARIVGVRVLGCNGSGTTAGVISGINWVVTNRVLPAVANMSLGGGVSPAMDEAVETAIGRGISFVVEAGNDYAADACTKSPARAPNAITVGATNSGDGRADFSNVGPCVDIFAPGASVTSAWIASDLSINTISGTSMAAPHTAGAVALLLQANPGLSPLQVTDVLSRNATGDVLTDLRGSVNHMLFVGEVNRPKLDLTLSGARNSSQIFKIDVPAGATNLQFKLQGGTGDADLYVLYNDIPDPFFNDCAGETQGNEEQCLFARPQNGTWQIMVYGFEPFSNVRLTVNY
jgi:serine protease